MDTFYRKNLLDLRIYFEDLNYDYLEEIPAYTASDYGGKLLNFTAFNLLLSEKIVTRFEL